MCWLSDWAPVNLFVAVLSLILVAFNFLKIRTPVLHIMTPWTTTGYTSGFIPTEITFDFVNMTTNYIPEVAIKKEVCLENKTIYSETIHKFIGPKSTEIISIDIIEALRTHYGLTKYQNIEAQKVIEGALRVRISYLYKFYFMTKNSYYIYRYPGNGSEWILERSQLP
jgi:hypothetical protein